MIACQFLLKWPTLQALQRARPQTIRQFYYAQRCRRPELVQARLDAIAQMIPFSADPALLEPAQIQVQMLARQLLHLGQAIKEYDTQIEERFALHRDAAIWQSFPGAGPTLAPRLACAFGSERSRCPDAAALQQYSGIAPVTEKSGKNQHWVHRRYSPPHFIHQSFFEYASQSALHCEWAKLYLEAQIARGKTHPSAVRALAFKWQRIMFKCWRDRLPYDEAKYLAALQKRRSFLAPLLEPKLKKAA